MTLIQSAIEQLQVDSSLNIFRALMRSRENSTDVASLVTSIVPAALGPDMIDQLVAWEKATTRDDVIATMQKVITSA